MLKRRQLLFWVGGLLLFTLLIGSVTAQEEEAPLREAARAAPEREPVVLQRQVLENKRAQAIIQLPAVADAYIASERPLQNFGQDSLFLGYNLTGFDNFGAQRLLLRFDVENNIPQGATINEAFLLLRLNFASPTNDLPMGTVLRRLASPWDEQTVTWNSEPDWTPVDKTTFVGIDPVRYEWEVTDLVQSWIDEDYPNNGVEIIGDETVQQRERAFYARETLTPYFPQLIIDYTTVDDTEPPSVAVNELPDFSGRSFTVSWEGEDSGGAGINYYDVQVRVDGGAWQGWQTITKETEAEYSEGENGRFYEFRARGVDEVGNFESYGEPEASTTVDTQPPRAVVSPLPALIDTTQVTVSWQSNLSVSGIAYYDVRYRVDGGAWQLWQEQTTDTSALFTAPADGRYQFEARAADNAGLVEPYMNEAEAAIVVDAEPPFLTPRLWLPLIFDG